MERIMKNHSVPIWEKYALTIEEATIYFGIGEKVLRRFLKEHADEDFLISNGVKTLVKRRAFEHYLDEKVTAL